MLKLVGFPEPALPAPGGGVNRDRLGHPAQPERNRTAVDTQDDKKSGERRGARRPDAHGRTTRSGGA